MNTVNRLRAIVLDHAIWAAAVAELVMDTVAQIYKVQGSCSVMLTGGRSAEQLYQAWARIPGFNEMRNVNFYFGDERCVPSGHPESNFNLAMRTLFLQGVPQGCTIIRMAAEQADHEAAAAAYAEQLPERIDLLLLSVGEDGHIASIFPNSVALFETSRLVVSVSVPKPPPERLTITPPVIARAKNVFVMALGRSKAAVLKRAQAEPKDIASLPARLVLNADWFLDTHIVQ